MDYLKDESLMESIQNGHLDACGLLYQRYKKPLWVYFYNCTRQKEKSEDLVQLTFERMIKYRKNYKGTGTFKSWLFSIARNVVKDDWNKKKKHFSSELDERKNLIVDISPTGEEQLIQKEKEALLEKAMLHLSKENRALLAMIKLNGKKYKEVAEIYQITESTLRVNVFRIMKELKAYVKKIQANRNY